MTAAMLMTKGTRAMARVLLRAGGVLLCAFGLAVMAQGLAVPVKARVAQVLLDRAFARSLAEGHPVRPWPWADTMPVARLTLPRLGASDVVLSGGSGQALAFGPTVVPNRRAGGGADVTILAAHRDTHFAFLLNARVGDAIDVQAIGGAHRRYRVTGFQVVRWDGFAAPRDPVRPLLALVTCYPFGATEHGPLRFVVWAEAL
ncbi:MAG: sortase, marine proteobacterial type [Novosphingobium sp. SCN 66-18]|nr:MAG: sortase, marine proteobacterial type [Novosphingobium sp. SCN 66-18]